MKRREPGWQKRLAKALEDRRRLRCVDCGRVDDGRERGWKLRLGDDHDLWPFCPECDELEFGDA